MREFIKKALSDNGQPSSARLYTGVSLLAVLVGWLHVCFHTHALPDGAASAGAATLATAPYALNSAANAVSNWKKKKNEVLAAGTPAAPAQDDADAAK